MNRLDTAMRVACRDPELDLVTRLLILELVELRQNGWNLNDNILAYYRQKLAQATIFSQRPSNQRVKNDFFLKNSLGTVP